MHEHPDWRSKDDMTGTGEDVPSNTVVPNHNIEGEMVRDSGGNARKLASEERVRWVSLAHHSRRTVFEAGDLVNYRDQSKSRP